MTKDEAIKICKQVRKYFKGGKLATDDTDAIYEALSMAIKALQEKKTGKWIGDKCSVCGEKRAWYGCNPKYCPDCGSSMRGEEE